MSHFTRALIATALLAAAGTTSNAVAGGHGRINVHVGKHFSGSFGGHHHHRHHRHVFVNVGGGGCGYYYDMWQDTGSYRWKKRYYQCKGWW